MSAMILCRACDTYQSGKGPHLKCEKCGAEGQLWREPEPGEEDECDGDW